MAAPDEAKKSTVAVSPGPPQSRIKSPAAGEQQQSQNLSPQLETISHSLPSFASCLHKEEQDEVF